MGFDAVALKHGFHIIPIKLGRMLRGLKTQIINERVLLFGLLLLLLLFSLLDGLERFLLLLDFLGQIIRFIFFLFFILNFFAIWFWSIVRFGLFLFDAGLDLL